MAPVERLLNAALGQVKIILKFVGEQGVGAQELDRKSTALQVHVQDD